MKKNTKYSLSIDINETFNPKRYINSQNKWEKDLSLFDKIIENSVDQEKFMA